MTGIKGVYRNVHLHALNLKETAIRHAAKLGRTYDECNFIVCHIGGGISISAHLKGKMVDGNDIVGGEGPMAPTRCGSVPAIEVAKYTAEHGLDVARAHCMKTGGFVDLLGTSDAIEVCERAAAGDKACSSRLGCNGLPNLQVDWRDGMCAEGRCRRYLARRWYGPQQGARCLD